MSSEASAPARNTKGTSRGQFVTVLGLTLVAVIVVMGYAILFFGSVVGQEFAPDSFARREFSFREIPLLGLQITPIYRRDVTNSLEAHLTGNQFISAPKSPAANTRWDLVVARRSPLADVGRIISQGDARILCEYLDAHDSNDQSIWLEWTEKHPELARVVWPVVARVARQELYIFAPDLLMLARNATDASHLKAELDVLLAEKYAAFGLTQQQLGNHAAAMELFADALSLVPGHAGAADGRAQSQAALGKGVQGPVNSTNPGRTSKNEL
jgi:hypothetical protein